MMSMKFGEEKSDNLKKSRTLKRKILAMSRLSIPIDTFSRVRPSQQKSESLSPDTLMGKLIKTEVNSLQTEEQIRRACQKLIDGLQLASLREQTSEEPHDFINMLASRIFNSYLTDRAEAYLSLYQSKITVDASSSEPKYKDPEAYYRKKFPDQLRTWMAEPMRRHLACLIEERLTV